jgi:hypothetical protein
MRDHFLIATEPDSDFLAVLESALGSDVVVFAELLRRALITAGYLAGLDILFNA